MRGWFTTFEKYRFTPPIQTLSDAEVQACLDDEVPIDVYAGGCLFTQKSKYDRFKYTELKPRTLEVYWNNCLAPPMCTYANLGLERLNGMANRCATDTHFIHISCTYHMQ